MCKNNINYRIFNITVLYFTEIIRIFETATIHCVNDFQWACKSNIFIKMLVHLNKLSVTSLHIFKFCEHNHWSFIQIVFHCSVNETS